MSPNQLLMDAEEYRKRREDLQSRLKNLRAAKVVYQNAGYLGFVALLQIRIEELERTVDKP